MKRFHLIACGATFDFFHKGHKEFLRFALLHGDTLLLGLTSDSYVSQKKSRVVESYEKRKMAVEEFLRQEGMSERVEIAPIDSVYIPKHWEERSIEAMVVTEESKSGAVLVQEKRRKEGKKELEILLFPFVPAEDGNWISSTRIRNGEIDREGNLWIKPDWERDELILPENVRSRFKQPLGKVHMRIEDLLTDTKGKTLVTVGDVTTKLFYETKDLPYLSIVDFIVERKKQYQSLKELGIPETTESLEIDNPAGTLSPLLFATLRTMLQNEHEGKHFVIQISGEEDLAVLPAILASPLGFVICYGQPGKGTVVVAVTEQIKEHVSGLVSLLQPRKRG